MLIERLGRLTIETPKRQLPAVRAKIYFQPGVAYRLKAFLICSPGDSDSHYALFLQKARFAQQFTNIQNHT